MTAPELFQFLYGWVNLVVNTEPVTDPPVPIIQSHQNAPAPKGVYLNIQANPELRPVGLASSGDATEPYGDVSHIMDYEAEIALWEVNGTGDWLRALVNSLSRQTIKDIWSAAMVSCLRTGTIFSLPRMDEHQWKHENRVDLILGMAFDTAERSGWIETVELNNNIGGSP